MEIFPTIEFNSSFIKEKFEKIGPFIIEEVITQGKEMSVLHPESINTVRIATIRNGESTMIYGGALRIGVGGRNVDNAGAGGIYAGIDTENGIVVTKARDNECNTFTIHPDTGVTIPGFILPKWDEAVELTKKLTKAIEQATLIAWDLAYSTEGWCLIEANDIGEQYLLQAPEQIGLKSRVLKELRNIADSKKQQ